MNEKQIHDFFKSAKTDIGDNGFSENVTDFLPERSSKLPKIIILASVALGLSAMASVHGFEPFYEQVYELAQSVAGIRMPSPGAIIHYCAGVLSTVITGLAIYKAGIA